MYFSCLFMLIKQYGNTLTFVGKVHPVKKKLIKWLIFGGENEPHCCHKLTRDISFHFISFKRVTNQINNYKSNNQINQVNEQQSHKISRVRT